MWTELEQADDGLIGGGGAKRGPMCGKTRIQITCGHVLTDASLSCPWTLRQEEKLMTKPPTLQLVHTVLH